MARLLIVSNRLPVSVIKRGGDLRLQPSVGGLATGLGSLLEKSYRDLWIGWSGISKERATAGQKNKIKKILEERNFLPIFLSQSDIESFYLGFCNRTIWPLFHYFTQHTRYDKNTWNVYVRVNKIFCDTVMKIIEPGDVVWVHDYHLMLLPQMLRERCPELTIGFFLHIPFPSFEVFRLLPWRREILEGLLGADLIGFHIYSYVRHFLDSVSNRLGYEHSLNKLFIEHHIVKVDTFPMGIDYDKFANAEKDSDVIKEIDKTRKKTKKLKIILSIDRLDYTKDILQRLHSLDLFLGK